MCIFSGISVIRITFHYMVEYVILIMITKHHISIEGDGWRITQLNLHYNKKSAIFAISQFCLRYS